MKIIGPLLIVLTSACSASADYTLDAKHCVQQQLAGSAQINALQRNAIAKICGPQIHRWAFDGLQKALGRPIDFRHVRERQEYLDRKQAIARLLMPLEGDPPTL